MTKKTDYYQLNQISQIYELNSQLNDKKNENKQAFRFHFQNDLYDSSLLPKILPVKLSLLYIHTKQELAKQLKTSN